jgi:hypothetical protein
MVMNKGRVIHITLHKCGSQWIRDVLCAAEILRFSGMSYSGETFDFLTKGQIELSKGEFSGPIYSMNRVEWQCWKSPGDKAIVVLRDPRDRLVSNLFSMLYSHSTNTRVECLRNILSGISNHDKRIKMLIWNFISSVRFYLTWAINAKDDAFVMRYESFLQDQRGEFRRILDWLGWYVPDEVLYAVVEKLSFKTRSGRSPGETDIFSHYRRGVEGDWRNHFSRENGRLWELLYPGFLTKIGYENSDDWWLSLPKEIDETTPYLSKSSGSDPAMDCRMETLTQRIKRVEKQLAEKEQEIQTLSNACNERLNLIERQDKELAEKELQIQILSKECHERLDLIERQDKELKVLSISGGSKGV